MIAQPTEYRGITLLDSIDAEQERSEMAGVLEPLEAAGKLTLSWTPSGNWPDFERRFFKPDFAEGWTVFHFLGHGDFDPRQGLGFLLFEEAGSSGGEAVYAERPIPLSQRDPEWTAPTGSPQCMQRGEDG